MSANSSSTRGIDDVAVLKRKGYALGISLGEGSYAKVKSAYSEKLKRNVAVKIIDRKKASTDFLGKFLPREMEILAVMDHKSVVKTYEIFETSGGKIYIIMELGVEGDLLEFIRSRGALPEKVASKLFSQLVTAVKYCHDMDIVHRDLKCENLLLDKDFNIKVTDFGFARRIPRDENDKIILCETYCGSAAYAAPEVLQGIPYQPKIYDIWSLGVILFIMVTGSLPYDDSNIKKMLIAQKEQQIEYPCSIHVSSECKDLIGRMLQPDVTCRITLEETLNHAWFTLNLQTKLQEISKKEETSYDTSEEKNKDKASSTSSKKAEPQKESKSTYQAINLRGKVLKQGRLTPTAETPKDSSPQKRRLLHSMIDKPVIQSEISGLMLNPTQE